MIYLDNAATSLHKPESVIEAVASALNSLGNAGRGTTTEALGAARIIHNTRVALAQLFQVENPARIAFTSNATESLNTAIKGILKPGDHVITTMLEHNSVLRPLYDMESKGVELTILKSDEIGNIDYTEIEKTIQENTKAIVCTHGSNLTGNIIDITRIGKIAKEYQLLFVVDASQTAGVFDIDVQAMRIDILCFTGHKSLLGPQGTGGIYVREGVDIVSLKAGGSGVDTYNHEHPKEMPTLLEAGTLNGHGIAGLGAGVLFVNELGVNKIRAFEQKLMRRFYEGVRRIENVKIYGDFTQEQRAPIVTLNIADYDSSEVSDELLMEYGISTRPGAHCAPLMHEALGTVKQGAVRFSFSYFNTIEEVDQAIEAVQNLSIIE